LPGRFGATYIGLRGLLHAEGIKEEEVTLNEIGFTQFEAVQAGSVPAAVGYANNEPLRLQESGVDVNVINVADYIQLVNNGVVINETYARDNAETVRRFIRATRRGLEATIKDPEAAFQDSLAQIPELAPDQQPFQRKVLAETIGYWRTADTDREGLGWPNPAAWRATYDFLRDSGILAQETNPDDAYALEFFK
jgi:NitT/TauT family transport system substrate-binding protein